MSISSSSETTLPETGFLRLPGVLKFIPVSKSTWLAGVEKGRFPKPIKLGPRAIAWRCQDIRALIDQFNTSFVEKPLDQ